MENTNDDNAKLERLRELWCHLDRAATTRNIKLPQHLIENIISALEGVEDWLESEADHGRQLPYQENRHDNPPADHSRNAVTASRVLQASHIRQLSLYRSQSFENNSVAQSSISEARMEDSTSSDGHCHDSAREIGRGSSTRSRKMLPALETAISLKNQDNTKRIRDTPANSDSEEIMDYAITTHGEDLTNRLQVERSETVCSRSSPETATPTSLRDASTTNEPVTNDNISPDRQSRSLDGRLPPDREFGSPPNKRKCREIEDQEMKFNDWSDLDSIIERVASPSEVYQSLMVHAGRHSYYTPEIGYLTRLFFHFGGPYAFEKVRDAFSATNRTLDMDFATIGGRVRALDRIEHALPIEQRAIVLSLYDERLRRQQEARQQGERQPDRVALRAMMACAYPDLGLGTNEYAEKKAQLQWRCQNGRNWSIGHKRCPSALWMFPANMSEKRFRVLPGGLVEAFFDLLYRIRGSYIRRIDKVLERQVAEFVQGKRRTRAIDFERMTISEMEGQPMDSDYFVSLCRMLVR